jgi:hypothetical protein
MCQEIASPHLSQKIPDPDGAAGEECHDSRKLCKKLKIDCYVILFSPNMCELLECVRNKMNRCIGPEQIDVVEQAQFFNKIAVCGQRHEADPYARVCLPESPQHGGRKQDTPHAEVLHQENFSGRVRIP